MTTPQTDSLRNSAQAAASQVGDALNSAEGMAKHATSSAADQVNQSLHALVQEVSPKLTSMAERVAQMSRQGMSAVHNGQHQINESLHDAKDSTVGYIRHEPVKSVLIAAALGATLVTLFNLLSRSKH